MNSLNLRYILIFFLISFFYVSIKYFLSILEYPDENFILKIIRFNDMEYAYLVESFSRLDFSTDWSKIEKSQYIIGFPIFSTIFHAVIFKPFGYYSFYILEIIFFFLIVYLFFKILLKFEKDKIRSLNGILILLIICQFVELSEFYYSGFFSKLNPITEFIGLRFPRPITTSIFAFFFLMNLVSLVNKRIIENKNNIYFISVCLALLINSFFHLFFIFFILAFICLTPKLLNEGLDNFNEIFKIISFSSLIILIGILIFFIQQNFSETDYANRIGVHYLSFNDKIKNSLEFLRIFTQLQYISLLIICLILKFFINFKLKDITLNKRLSIFLLFVFSSFVSPIIFLFASNKIIVSHHFLTITKFSLFLFIFISLFLITKKFLTKELSYISIVILFLLLTKNFYTKDLNNDKINEEVKIYNFLKQNEYINSEKILFANKNFFFDNVWFSLGNRYISVVPGFVSSQKDSQIENSIFQIFKIFNINETNFDQKINNKMCKRECFAEYFNYKFIVNSMRHYKPLEKEYSEEIVKKIKGISEIDWWYLFIPNSEKIRLKNKFLQSSYDQNHDPHIIILRNKEKLLSENDLSKDYKKVINGEFYNVFELID